GAAPGRRARVFLRRTNSSPLQRTPVRAAFPLVIQADIARHGVVALNYTRCSYTRVHGMDRLDAMKVFVVAVDEGSLSAAARKLRRSPAAVSRAIAFLEERAGSKLLHRTTRSIKLSEEGERYVASYRRVLTELQEADDIVS